MTPVARMFCSLVNAWVRASPVCVSSWISNGVVFSASHGRFFSPWSQ